ncbi:hypothetical protein F2Q70_00034619 [Brassica cretica]|uniref:Uncharacterized protein n=1 Tax=Brassica cretica TaxID=69181 RepID=A0A8S9JRC2_BRACR|nr:hypothetical protein F2Q70_00034619 [Brassica cretica]
MMFWFMSGSDASSRQIKTDRRLIGGYYCMGSRRSERQRQAVEELNCGLGAFVGGSERTLERGCVLDAMAYAIAHGNASMCLDAMVMLSDRVVNGSKERVLSFKEDQGMDDTIGTAGGVLAGLDSVLMYTAQGSVLLVLDGLRAGWSAEFLLIDLGVINDWFWNASKAGVLSLLDGWLETKPSLFVHGHGGMVG